MASIPSNYQCRLLVERIVLGKGCNCPHCQEPLKRTRLYYWRRTCRKKIYLKSLTWLKGTKLSCQQLYLLITAWQDNAAPGATKSLVKLSYPTITRWYDRFRLHLPRESTVLDGAVEVDEAYFGKKKHHNQEIVIGAFLRGLKKLRLKVILDAGQDELEDFVWQTMPQRVKCTLMPMLAITTSSIGGTAMKFTTTAEAVSVARMALNPLGHGLNGRFGESTGRFARRS